MARVFIALGSNLGDRKKYLSEAVRRIDMAAGISLRQVSSLLETEPVDYLDQPDFINQMIEVETNLSPTGLLVFLQGIENVLGRRREIPKGPRTIDLDIILYDELVIESEELIIPHPGRLERDFIVRHLVELDPELRDPVSGKLFRLI